MPPPAHAPGDDYVLWRGDRATTWAPPEAGGQVPFGVPSAGTTWRGWSATLLTVVLAVTVLQRFAVPGTDSVVGVGFVVGVAVTVIGLGTGVLRVDPVRLALYLLAMAGLLLTLLVKWAPFSTTSFVMLAVLYLPFVAMIVVSAEDYRRGLWLFQQVMTVIAIAGLAQYAVQFVAGPDAMFPFDLVVPEEFFIAKFNLRIPVGDGGGLLKSTGLFFLEPSHFSQFLGVAILVEIAYFRRFSRLALMAVAYVTSFSGTGMILMLAVSLPLAVRTRQYWVLVLLLLGVLLLPWLQDVPGASLFLNRVDEFDNTQGSGSMRFFGPYRLAHDALQDQPLALWFGFGPGTIFDQSQAMDYAVSDSSPIKLLMEYGVVGVMCFFPFYLYVLFANSPDRVLSFACLVQFLLLGGYLNAFYVQFLMLALVGWPRVAPAGISPRDPRFTARPGSGRHQFGTAMNMPYDRGIGRGREHR